MSSGERRVRKGNIGKVEEEVKWMKKSKGKGIMEGEVRGKEKGE